MRATRVTVVLAALFSALFADHAWPLDGQPLVTGFSLASWVDRDGVPIGPVRAIAQDEDGYLWLATDSGALRFDGVRFATPASLGLANIPSSPARALMTARDRALWMGFADGGGVRVIRGGLVETPGDGLAGIGVSSLAEDTSGTVWATTSAGLYRFERGTWAKTPLVEGAGDTSTLFADKSGHLWVGTSTGLFKQTEGARFERVGESRAAIRGITQDRHGQVWVTDAAAGFRRADQSRPAPHGREASGLGVFVDRQSNLWVATRGQGLWRVRDPRPDASTEIEVATVDHGLVSNGVWFVLEDHEDNLWIGSQQGLNRLTPHTVTPIADVGVVRSVEAASDGGVWAGTAGGLLRVSGRPTGAGYPRLGDPDVTALHRDGSGTVWVAATGGLGRVREGRFASIPLGVTPRLTQIQSITDDRRGVIWFADAGRGLFRLHGGHAEPYALPHDVASRPIRFIHADHLGRVWVAMDGGVLGYVDVDGRYQRAGPDQGLADGTHETLQAVAGDDDGVVWIGGSGGLTRFADGRFVTIGRETGLPGRRVSAIAGDRFGHLWIAIDNVIVRMHRNEFTRAAAQPEYRIQHVRLDTSHGLGGIPVGSTNEGVARADDGGLWFVTGWGLTFVDPNAVNARRLPSEIAVRIEGAVADEARVGPAEGVSLPAGTARVRIDYTALRLTTPTRTRFRYKLEGFDAGWIDAGTRRQAFYTNLPPREYRFVVQADSGDGIWTPTGATWSFAIAPMFYQTATFYVLGAGLLLCASWGAWQLRLRHVRREFQLVLAERARLSREIHDTLLQNLAGVAIQCAGISNALEPSSPARAQLVTVRRQVESYVRDIRQAVWDLRAPVLEAHDLPGALRQFGARATAGTSVRFDLVVHGKPRQLASKVENDVLRIGEESIRNAVRHAHATHVRLELRFEGDSLTLRTSDNGCGFDVSHQASGDHQFGLIGMRERALELGGRLRIAIPPTGGTEIELIVPASPQPQGA